jgi:tRNA(Ile2) C34 agmatinyltransferase TiaS
MDLFQVECMICHREMISTSQNSFQKCRSCVEEQSEAEWAKKQNDGEGGVVDDTD